MSVPGYVPSDAEFEAGIRYLDARRRQWRMIPLVAVAALVICWLPVESLLFDAAWWTVTVVPIIVLVFAAWVFTAQGRAKGESDVAFAWMHAARGAGAPPLDVYLTQIEKHRQPAD
jgi:hypothetical protein